MFFADGIASVNGLTDGLATHINNLRTRSEEYQASLIEQSSLEKELASALQNHLKIDTEGSHVHPDRIPQIDKTVNDSCEVEIGEPELD